MALRRSPAALSLRANDKEACVAAAPGLNNRIVAWLRANGGHVLVEALVNFILPFVIYSYAEAPLGDVRALLASSAPPIAWSLVEFARHRRVDALSVLVVAGIVLSLLAVIGGGGAKFLQLRENLVTGIIGLAFLGSALIGKPLIYQLARASMRRKSEGEAREFEALQVHAAFRRTMMVMTLVWGLGLLANVAVSVVLVFALTIRTYLIVGPIVGYATMGALTLWTFLYGQRARRRGEERRAAGEQAAATAELGGA
jgi:intracellular septation protein A